MEAPSDTVLLVSGYAGILLLLAWIVDRLGMWSAHRAARWRTGNFLYHEDQDAWKCHQDQWLWPASFDPDKRVIRYQGQHAVCGRCPVKADCSPTPGPRELTRQLDPWPHSEAGRFHRGISLCVGIVAAFLPAAMLVGARAVIDVVVLVTTLFVTVVATVPLARHLWDTPSNFPAHLPRKAAGDAEAEPAAVAGLEELIDRYSTRWSGDARATRLDPEGG
jgi:hypothetical protein